MRLIRALVVIANEDLHVVLNAQRLSLVAVASLQSHRRWRVRWELEGHGKGIVAELLDQLFLQRCHLHLGRGVGAFKNILTFLKFRKNIKQSLSFLIT